MAIINTVNIFNMSHHFKIVVFNINMHFLLTEGTAHKEKKVTHFVKEKMFLNVLHHHASVLN